MTIFYVSNFKVDLSRSVIVKQESQTKVEPKVLKVLLLLAEHQGEVVTHDTIKAKVWQGAEVVPNALQRCIAILRKTLDDDAKSPKIILTHPRIGYSLSADVSWESTPKDIEGNNAKGLQQSRAAPTSRFRFVLAIIAALLATALWFTQKSHNRSLPTTYAHIERLTQTDAHESHAILSPDAGYIVFNRYAGGCTSHIWARDVASAKEFRLTDKPSYIGVVSFTGDGREIVFAAKQGCQEATRSSRQAGKVDPSPLCWTIASMDFALALSRPQTPTLRYQCQADGLETVKPLGNHQYAFLQFNGQHKELMLYDDLNKSTSVLYRPEQNYLYHFDYDPQSQRFALLSRYQESNNVLEILDKSGKLSSKATIRLPEQADTQQGFKANFAANGEYLLATNNNRLFRLHLDGQLQYLKTPETNIQSAVQHPSQAKLVAVIGHKDVDIAKVAIGNPQPTPETSDLHNRALPFTSFSRSTSNDRHAKFQPLGEHIAFLSDRSGEDQIWLWRDNILTQLSNQESQGNIHQFHWAPDGKSIAWVSNGKLAISDLNGNVRFLQADKLMYSILSWHKTGQLFVSINDPIPGGLYRYDIAKGTLHKFGLNQVEAVWINGKSLYYSVHNGSVFLAGLDNPKAKPQFLPALNGKAMLLKANQIFSVDQNTLSLSQYNLNGEWQGELMPLKPMAWKVTDLRENQLLLDQFIAISNDIVVLQ